MPNGSFGRFLWDGGGAITHGIHTRTDNLQPSTLRAPFHSHSSKKSKDKNRRGRSAGRGRPAAFRDGCGHRIALAASPRLCELLAIEVQFQK